MGGGRLERPLRKKGREGEAGEIARKNAGQAGGERQGAFWQRYKCAAQSGQGGVPGQDSEEGCAGLEPGAR